MLCTLLTLVWSGAPAVYMLYMFATCRQGCVNDPNVTQPTAPAACSKLINSWPHAHIQAFNKKMNCVIELPFQHAGVMLVTNCRKLHL